MLLKESRTQPGVNSSAQLESQAEISLSVGVACESPVPGVLPFTALGRHWVGLHEAGQ